MAELNEIEVALLDDHPDNPRLTIREDVVDGIVANLNGSWPKEHALIVRPVGDRYQIVSGHHRKHAASKAKFERVWCWVKDMNDKEAFMALATSNNQGELDPLEIGIHALRCVPPGKAGRGKKGGVANYARAIGRHQPNVSVWMQGAEVYEKIKSIFQNIDLASLCRGRSQHLAAIRQLDEAFWLPAVEWLIDSEAAVSEVKKVVDKVKSICERIDTTIDFIFPPDVVFGAAISDGGFGPGRVKDICSEVAYIVNTLNESEASLGSEYCDGIREWLVDNIGGDSWSVRKLKEKVSEINAELKRKTDEDAGKWNHGNWRDHIDKLENDSVNLLLIDPPYGMDWSSNRRKEKHKKIDSDEEVAIASEELEACVQSMRLCLNENSHVLIFCRYDSVGSFQAICRRNGLRVKGLIVWVKNNHGTGDLKGSFLPKHELIIHAVAGKPTVFGFSDGPAVDVIECAKEPTDSHPSKKPVELLKELIQATTVSGELVVDLFAGVGSTCVAAKDLGRDWFGVELDEAYHKIGMEALGLS